MVFQMAWEPSLSPVALRLWVIFGMGNLGLQQHTIKMEILHTRLLMERNNNETTTHPHFNPSFFSSCDWPDLFSYSAKFK